MAHQGLNDLDIQIATALAFTELCPELKYTSPRLTGDASLSLSPSPPTTYPSSVQLDLTSRPFRVGFLSCNLFDHSIGRILVELISYMDSLTDVTVSVFLTDRNVHSTEVSGIHDQITDILEQLLGDRFVRLSGDIADIRSVVGGPTHSLDALVFADVGMEFSSYVLSHSRMAPIQVSVRELNKNN